MERVIDVAKLLFDEYKKKSGCIIDEMKLHKLLYLVQRESFAITGNAMFDGMFEGWKYGPVCRSVRSSYTSEDGILEPCDPLSLENAYIVRNVLEEYGGIESWKLSELTHKEISWRRSREGLSPDEIGSVPLLPSDIMTDAAKVRPYDHVWDMYYDEFDDAECVNI